MEAIIEHFSIENNELLHSALTHKSLMSNEVATKKYGICQNMLAAKGDARLKGFIVDYVHEQHLDFPTQQRFEMNSSLALWADKLEITKFFITGNLKNETRIHAIGTFMEALIELVYQKYGHDTTELFIRYNYFSFIQRQLNSSTEATNLKPMNTPVEKNNTHTINPVIDSKVLATVKNKLAEKFSRKYTLVCKELPDNQFHFKLSFHYGYGAKAKPVSFESQISDKTTALNQVCHEALQLLGQSIHALA
jgi:dsRNA-specific ribonuclease